MPPRSLSTSPETDQPGPRRCLAKTRSGGVCQKLALKQKARCRLHGGLSTGAPRGELNGNYKNGRYTCEALAERKRMAAAGRLSSRRIKLATKMGELLGMFDRNADQEAMARKNWRKLNDLREEIEALDDAPLETL